MVLLTINAPVGLTMTDYKNEQQNHTFRTIFKRRSL